MAPTKDSAVRKKKKAEGKWKSDISMLTLYSPLVTLCTTRFNMKKKSCLLPTECMCVFRMILTAKGSFTRIKLMGRF
jgi:hypothetical protein